MDFKTLTKSKSSNGAIGATTENKKHKKSLSNAQFQPSVVKKRGVYVEKKIQSSTHAQEANDTNTQAKPPRRPRPGQKKFLASILTILSKSTTGTQYPDTQDSTKEKAPFTPQSKYMQKCNKTKKTKYRSRILNDEMLKSEKDQLIILQPKKEITQTPSTNSFRVKTGSDIRKTIDENEPKRSAIRDILDNNIYSGVAEGITKKVLEGKPKKEKRLTINDDPETIASEIENKDDKNMYNFFVDLLETTISVYNVKTEYEISDVSKTAFELDNTVAEQLVIKNDRSPSHEKVNYTSTCEPKHIIEKDTFDIIEDIPHYVKPSEYKPFPAIKPKMKAKSFLDQKSNRSETDHKSITYTRKTKPVPKSKSFDKNNTFFRKPNKRQILNDLKEELAKETRAFNEPESLYDALKVMAKNKRRNEKFIQFVNKINKRNNNLDFECMFERRKVISFGLRKNNQSKRKLPTSESKNKKKTDDYNDSNGRYFPSRHSLAVYGYDYDEPEKLLESKREKRIIFNYHSSRSTSGSNTDDYDAMIYNTGSSGNNCWVQSTR